MDSHNLFETALDYHRQGLTPVPFENGTKNRPFWGSWKEYQQIPQSLSEVKVLFYGLDSANIALVGGVQSQQGYPFVVDSDSSEKAVNFRNVLAGLGIETWEAQRDHFLPDDPHAGGQHFYFLADQPVKTTNCKFGEVRGKGAIVIAPFSTHPTGTTYQFKQKPPVIFRLDSLQAIPELGLTVATDKSNRTPRLAWNLLQGKSETVAKYRTRSEAEAALCASLIRAGYDFEGILTLLIVHPGPGKFTELYHRNNKNGVRYLYHTFQNAYEFVRQNPNQAGTIAHQLIQWAQSQPWPGRTGATDKAVYLAHLDIVLRCGKLTYGASCRELAEKAGVAWQTVPKANKRLIASGLIVQTQMARPSLSNVWTLNMDVVPNFVTQSTRCDGVTNYGKNEQSHDVFRWAGLNKTGHAIYQALKKLGIATPQEIVKETGRGKTTVYRKLRDMEKYLMAEPVGQGKWQALEVNLDIVARMLGTYGKGEKQRKRHAQERRLHQLVLRQGKRDKSGDSGLA